jgi:hypothetical protein
MFPPRAGRAIAVALVASLISANASAQVPAYTLPQNTVVGRSANGIGPAQAIPFQQLLGFLLQSAPNIPTINTNSIVFKGSISGQATVQAQANAGMPTLSLPTGSGTLASSATAPIVLDPVTGIVSCPLCVTSTAAASPIIPSRGVGQTLNLSSFTGLVTAGYADGGDGGGATFKNVGTAPFLDSFIPTGTGGGTLTAGGSSYTNGTYHGVPLSGGTGAGAIATVVVSGGSVTSITITGTGGNGYTVGDNLNPPASFIGGTGSGVNWKVTNITTPTGSFTDSVGTHFQIIVDQGNYINIRQFGAVINWTAAAGDASATNDKAAVQNALNFAGAVVGVVDGGGFTGSTVIVPKGAAKVCGGLMVPGSVILSGMGEGNSVLKQCDSDASTQNFITLCDPLTQHACFYAKIKELTLFGANATSTGTTAMVYSNNQQQADAIERVAIYPIARACVFTETGYGGASNFNISQLLCSMNVTATPFGISLNYDAAVQTVENSIFESSGSAADAIEIQTGGMNIYRGIHIEGIANGFHVNVPSGTTHPTWISGITGGNSMTNLIVRQSGSAANQIVAGKLNPNGATNTINNSGTTTTGLVMADTVF